MEQGLVLPYVQSERTITPAATLLGSCSSSSLEGFVNSEVITLSTSLIPFSSCCFLFVPHSWFMKKYILCWRIYPTRFSLRWWDGSSLTCSDKPRVRGPRSLPISDNYFLFGFIVSPGTLFNSPAPLPGKTFTMRCILDDNPKGLPCVLLELCQIPFSHLLRKPKLCAQSVLTWEV